MYNTNNRYELYSSLLDSFPLPGHTRGSSHGASRVIRYLGDDDLAKLEYRDSAYSDFVEMVQ